MSSAAGILASIFFFLAGQAFIPLLGIQNDEALFGGPLYEPLEALYAVRVGPHSQIPLMLMSYLGCVKTLIYRPIFKLFGSGAYSVREPALIIGAAGIWIFFLLLRRVAGTRAAWIGCALLAADSLYLLTTCYDWGPVALQHLLTIAALYCLVRFCRQRSSRWLAAGSLLWGLALWDKALAVWLLSGFVLAGILLFPRPVLAALSWRKALLAGGSLALGALPLIAYNLHEPLASFKENARWDAGALPRKFHFVTLTASGGALLDFWNASDANTPAPHAPADFHQKVAARIAAVAGNPSSDLLPVAFLAAVLLAPFAGWPAFRGVLFFLIAMAVAWFEMAMDAHTGATVHHVILLWPWPYAAIAISFAALSRRLGRFGVATAAALVVLIAGSELLVTNEYYAKIARNGGTPTWSAAIFPLAESLKHSGAPQIFCTDWGYLDTLIVLNHNRPVVRDGIGPVTDEAAMKWALSDPANLFVGHAKEAEVNPGANEKFIQAAKRFGREPQTVATIGDGYGRNIFVVFRFR